MWLLGWFDVEFKIKNFFNVQNNHDELVSGITIQITHINNFELEDDFEDDAWKILISDLKLSRGPFNMDCYWQKNIELVS